ncbi:sugar phosphorylase [Devosia sp. RR2S18]|uniref:sugar phosphorylase n=1 Tax=Devosia rhizosphaerae TaxID=3049774 RepID=UPI002541F8F8|nr:sugar phosphorylase [Devosia sp. RR2S18]WIJ24264.1 sugar phosphorylase [Devosia sp. RR2S18]
MKLRDLLARVKDLPPDTLVCVAEVDEAFAANVAEIEHVDSAKAERSQADGKEAINLDGGSEKVLVIRW